MGLVTDAPYHDLCYRIIGAAMDVHNRFGPGLREAHYQKALVERLRKLGSTPSKSRPWRSILTIDQSEGYTWTVLSKTEL